tara:strand:+ start:14443 stop:15354 length:912 start_codon:yes stop_codon:yes gene_type:complete
MIDAISPLIKQFLPFAQEKMGFKHPPRLFLRGDAQNAENPLGKTAFYDPNNVSVTLYTTGRHVKDVMRSLAHELVHHTQYERGEFENCGEMGEGYAQNDEHLREMEREAYEMGNMCFRDWEDGIKNTIYFEHLQKGELKKMSTKDWKNNEIKSLLSEAWGFKMDLNKLNEVSTEDPKAPDDETKGDATTETEKEDLKVNEEENDEALQEDSEAAETRHYRDNAMNDDDHIKAIKHHLDALEKDRNYDEEHIDEEKVNEKSGRGRIGPHTRGKPDKRARQENKVRTMIRKALSEVTKAQKAKKG